jgi:hypothetical protein
MKPAELGHVGVFDETDASGSPLSSLFDPFHIGGSAFCTIAHGRRTFPNQTMREKNQ